MYQIPLINQVVLYEKRLQIEKERNRNPIPSLCQDFCFEYSPPSLKYRSRLSEFILRHLFHPFYCPYTQECSRKIAHDNKIHLEHTI